MGNVIGPLEAARNRDFGVTLYVEYFGDPLPLTDATVKMEVRQYEGQAGDALAADEDVTFTDEDTGRTDIDPSDGLVKPLRQLILEPMIAQADMAALPGQNQPEAGDPQRFSYEIVIEYADGARDSVDIDDFNVRAGTVE